MNLAIFDLDNTLLGGDSDHAWGEFLVHKKCVDVIEYKKQNDRFFEDYGNGCLDMQAYQEFALAPLTQFSFDDLQALHNTFMQEVIRPMCLPKAEALIEQHRQAQDELLIITATNRFITEPIAHHLGIRNLLATDPEIINGRYTGKIQGQACFQAGKLSKLQTWLREKKLRPSLCWFYSDSANDIPLLEHVEKPVAVDPDPSLRAHAKKNAWPIISLR